MLTNLLSEHFTSKTPAPVPSQLCRRIHAGLTAKGEHILKREDHNVRHRTHQRTNKRPVDLTAITVQVLACILPLVSDVLLCPGTVACTAARPPVQNRIVIMRSCVSDQIACVIVRSKRGSLEIGAEGKMKNRHSKKTEPMANGLDFRR